MATKTISGPQMAYIAKVLVEKFHYVNDDLLEDTLTSADTNKYLKSIKHVSDKVEMFKKELAAINAKLDIFDSKIESLGGGSTFPDFEEPVKKQEPPRKKTERRTRPKMAELLEHVEKETRASSESSDDDIEPIKIKTTTLKERRRRVRR